MAQWQISNVSVKQVVDVMKDIDLTFLIPDAAPENLVSAHGSDVPTMPMFIDDLVLHPDSLAKYLAAFLECLARPGCALVRSEV